MIKVTDFIAKYIAESEYTAKDVFLVSGGGCMHIIDSIGRNKDLTYYCNHHEQACTIAAEGFARVTNKIGVAVVTTGPGGTNAITGVMGAWVDSIPTLTISGQVKTETTILNHPGLRQLGDQEINIVDIVKPITKYAVMVTDKNTIKYHLEKAVYLARTGRPGPVWIDVPLDIQGAFVDEDELVSFNESDMGMPFNPDSVSGQINAIVDLLNKAERPVFVVGNGIRLSGATKSFLQLAEKLNMPVLTAISGADLIPSDHPLFFGRPGILGERPANYIMQNSDLMIVIGTRMNLRLIGYAFQDVARSAKKVMVDIDLHELHKSTFRPDIRIHSDAKYFISKLLANLDKDGYKSPDRNDWLSYCARLRKTYPVVTDEHRRRTDYVSSYFFAEALSGHTKEGDVLLTGNGCAYTSTFQAIALKKNQRLFANVGCAAMGYDMPAAIGACVANKKRSVICITGDGSIQMNLQEFQTIVHNNLPIKVFMFNNEGYLSIKITQESFFEKNYVGCHCDSGVSIPNMLKLMEAYGIPAMRVKTNAELSEKMESILSAPGPMLIEVMLDPHEKLGPKAFSWKKPDGAMVSRPLEDLYPFLDRDEFLSNMIIEPTEASIEEKKPVSTRPVGGIDE